ncbi:hypothetical protein [Nitrospira defluvii]|uniref:hypothetical protein n=1 Tax=Nitrospira defluvii TaxID=330214 RepID=UPI001BB48027|nr:hypothetical protein [Nitrospira defluvii]
MASPAVAARACAGTRIPAGVAHGYYTAAAYKPACYDYDEQREEQEGCGWHASSLLLLA